MPTKQTLNVTELRLLLVTHFNMEQSKLMKLQARLGQAPNNEGQEEESKVAAINSKLTNWVSGVLALRLKRNRRTTPLISSRDFIQLLPTIIDEVEKVEGEKLDVKSRKVLEKFMKSMFNGIFEAVNNVVPPHKNPYEHYWRWIMTVLELAAERDILPTELLSIEEATDEITRRMYSKKQFVTLSRKATKKFMDADVLKKLIIQIEFGIIDDEEVLRSLEQDLEEVIMPQLRENMKKYKVILNEWFDAEIKRIYGAA